MGEYGPGQSQACDQWNLSPLTPCQPYSPHEARLGMNYGRKQKRRDQKIHRGPPVSLSLQDLKPVALPGLDSLCPAGCPCLQAPCRVLPLDMGEDPRGTRASAPTQAALSWDLTKAVRKRANMSLTRLPQACSPRTFQNIRWYQAASCSLPAL